MYIEFFKINKRLLIIQIAFLLFSGTAVAEKCLYISSYHQGYEWSDGVEKGLRSELEGKCVLKQFDMDTKRNKDEAYKKAVGIKAKELILSWQPDVVIASDDNAAKYIIKPYFKDHSLPFVFCGINWNVDAYGFPYSNVTGMVEVAPIADLFKKVSTINGKPGNAFYIGADTLTEKKNLARFEQEAIITHIDLHYGLAKNSREWIDFYKRSQEYDFVIVGSNSGINDWDQSIIQKEIKILTRKLSVTNHEWMMPYTILGLTKIPEEQGIWAAQAALFILDGVKPSDIPIVSNRKWDLWINEDILKISGVNMPRSLIKKAKRIIE